MLRVILSLALATGVAVSAVYAADGQTGSNNNANNNSKWSTKTLQQQFNLKDVNKDGKLTWKEFKGSETNGNRLVKLEKMFKAMDTTRTGYVTFEQYKTYWQTKANQTTTKTTTNKTTATTTTNKTTATTTTNNTTATTTTNNTTNNINKW